MHQFELTDPVHVFVDTLLPPTAQYLICPKYSQWGETKIHQIGKITKCKGLFIGMQDGYQSLDKFIIHLLTSVNQGLVTEFALISNERVVEIAELIMWSTVLAQAQAGLVIAYASWTRLPIIMYESTFQNSIMNNSDFKLNDNWAKFLVQSAIVFENPGWSRERIEIHAVRKDYYGGINSISIKVIQINSWGGLWNSASVPYY